MGNPKGSAAQGGQQARETRQEQRLRLQAERRQQATLEQRTRRIKHYSLWGGMVAAALIIFLIARVVTGGTTDHIAGVVTYPNLARTHVTGPVKYPQVPPVGGPHNATPLNCGIYDTPVPNENAVHSLEHGAVWITYLPSLSAADVARLRSLVSGHDHALLSPYPGLPSPVVASAWGLQLKVQRATDPRLAQFLQKYEQGPQTPELGASCSGGVGNPIG